VMFLKSHHAQVEALVRRADDLERQASNAAAEDIRKIESAGTRARSQGNAEQLEALVTVAEVGMELLGAIRELHRRIVEHASSAPSTTWWERRRLRKDLAGGVAGMERGVASMRERNI
jgi:hypothetical protein